MTGLAALVLRLGIPQRMSRTLLICLAALLLIATAVAAWNVWLGRHDRRVVEDDRAKATVQVLKNNAGAQERSALERVVDERAVAAQEREMIDAIQSAPDTAPGPARMRLNCERLRRAGTDVGSLPQCR
jgi:hypothetical protein